MLYLYGRLKRVDTFHNRIYVGSFILITCSSQARSATSLINQYVKVTLSHTIDYAKKLEKVG